jgi:hypothetical protein
MYMTSFMDSVINVIITYHALLCLGFECNDITFIIVLGDDLLFTLSQDSLNKIQLSANEVYRRFDAKRKELYNMTSLSRPKVVSRDKNQIVFLKYKNLNGRPIRDLEELTAGALTRERHLKPQYLASVLIGLAYAAVGTCPEYHACLKNAYDFCIKAGNDKGIKQEIDNEDRFIEQLRLSLQLTDDDIMTFPTYEYVRDLVMTVKSTPGIGTYTGFNHEAFVYPNTSYSYLFETCPVEPDVCEEFISSIP